jgi:hypothetical protein
MELGPPSWVSEPTTEVDPEMLSIYEETRLGALAGVSSSRSTS